MEVYRQMAAETTNGPDAHQGQHSAPPTGVAVLAADNTIRSLMEANGKIDHWSEFDRGGHFPAMEVPDLLVGDVRSFFAPLR
jgi:epoxide hydrolase